MPDLSACESCTDFQEVVGGLLWSANCCGVPVSGVWLPMLSERSGCPVETRSVSIEELGLDCVSTGVGAVGRNFCVMLSPIIAPYAVQVNYAMITNPVECSEFIPKCAFTYCSEEVLCSYGGFD